ncbi:hypothetical protein BDZ89DRAFT_1100483 [Hymenopellis radicata]|nr:hypothetical protein BDZ89DRAFT_1100483 [Hymenopellis radicata]
MSQFTSRRELLNPFFEGYRLSIIPQEDAVSRCNLADHAATQSTVSNKILLTFKEMQSRIAHNHLASLGKQAVYVDAEFNLIAIDLEPVSLRVVFELPKPVQGAEVAEKQKEYPSAAFLSSTALFLSDGHGSLYLLEPSDTGPYKLVSSYQFPGSFDVPFRIHSADIASPQSAVVVLSSRNYEPSETTSSKHAHVDFDVWGIRFDLSTSDAIPSMSILWHRRGEDVPLDVYYFPSTESHLLLGSSQYRNIGSAAASTYEPSADEIAPIPRANEDLDAKDAAPPPYSWHQTLDSLTVAFPLPATTVRANIHAQFFPHSISLHVEGDRPEGYVFPEYDNKALWAPIDSSVSVWTWDREADHAFGLLTLHLEKQHEGTKWMQVFSAAATSGEEEVTETVDPSELYKVREALEKYTTSLREGDDLSGLGLGKGIPSLAEGEMDDEVDASVGKQGFLTVVPANGTESTIWGTYPLRLLSTPLPGYPTSRLSLISKENVDGVVFSLNDDFSWTHSSTFSALAFVLASKRDTRFVYHTENTVLAFESGAQNRGGNLYIYRSVPPNEKWAKQSVLQVGDGLGGALLGVTCVERKDGSRCIICLTETELVTIKSIW